MQVLPQAIKEALSRPQQEIRFPKMVTNCCRFLCYFCRISRQNQRSMFDHLSYLLQNSGIGLGELPGSVQGLGYGGDDQAQR